MTWLVGMIPGIVDVVMGSGVWVIAGLQIGLGPDNCTSCGVISCIPLLHHQCSGCHSPSGKCSVVNSLGFKYTVQSASEHNVHAWSLGLGCMGQL